MAPIHTVDSSWFKRSGMKRSTSYSSSVSGRLDHPPTDGLIGLQYPPPSDVENAWPAPVNGETLEGPSRNQNQNPSPAFQSDLQNRVHRRSLPSPLPPAKCPLVCVFYAEFDIVVGPKVCYQSPHKFMHLDVDARDEDVNQALEETFQAVMPTAAEPRPTSGEQDDNGTSASKHSKHGDKREDSYDYWSWSPNSKKAIAVEREALLPGSVPKHDKPHVSAGTSGTESNHALDESTLLTHSRNTSFASSKGATQPGDASTIDAELLPNSIFAATSEYIITGNELANQTVTVSTHNLHILSRPMIICNTNRYERNSLLFSVGFLLRRNVDPRPYWPCLSKLSSTFRAMEMESEFLSHRHTRPRIQIVLEDVLVALNSKRRSCHLVLDEANALNLELFRPPPPPTPPIPDHAVPILLRPEWQLQMYDWDLTIDWIVPHIDGCNYLKQIAVSSEVDIEMVRACLRVLRHHGVLAYVDVFRYSNVYECTPLAMRLLNGPSGKKAEEVKEAAFWYSAKAKNVCATHNEKQRHSPACSPLLNGVRSLYPHTGSLYSLDLSVHGAASPWISAVSTQRPRSQSKSEEELPRSFPSRTGRITIREEHSLDEDEPPDTTSHEEMKTLREDSSQLEQINTMKKAISQIYSMCNRNQSFGEMLLAKVEGETGSVDGANEKNVSSNLADSPDAKKLDQQQATGRDTCGLAAKIDWEMAFDFFDHRRLITFGLVHGLIRRVHQYPLAHEVVIAQEYSSEDAHGDEAEDFNNMELSPKDSAPMTETVTTSTNSASNWSQAHPVLSLPQRSFLPPPRNAMDKKRSTKLTREERHLQSRQLLLKRIATAMDGTRCDDELMCMFEISIEKLVEMLQSTGRWNIISVFSCTS